MIARLRRAIRSARAASLASRAEELAADGKFAEALGALERVHKVRRVAFPSPTTPSELNLLICQVAIGVEDGPLALAAAQIAITRLQESRDEYSAADRRYLLAFARALANYCLRWRDGDRADEMPNPILDIPTGSVSERLRQRFVMPPEGSYLDPLPPSEDQALH